VCGFQFNFKFFLFQATLAIPVFSSQILYRYEQKRMYKKKTIFYRKLSILSSELRRLKIILITAAALSHSGGAALEWLQFIPI
jgi:hypothetical protein